ncbi:unnamed protein product [Prorocentrum cordatum]|uniref:Uncharacterized protein n=1 Tax=Prorocentrum cordatum TaxID=2364126 RepID=A0ABN9XQE9_9DINO|nr:unnamed protein product [Polarella glacialis]
MGVFWDWPSLLQGDPTKADEAKAAALRQGKSEKDAQEAADEAKRTPAEKAAFKHALEDTMDLWYAHQATTVLLLTQHPRERSSARECGYDQASPAGRRTSAALRSRSRTCIAGWRGETPWPTWGRGRGRRRPGGGGRWARTSSTGSSKTGLSPTARTGRW